MALSCSESSCGMTADGVCCSAGGNWGSHMGTGICVKSAGLAECNYFGGSFWDYFYYEELYTDDNDVPYMAELETPVPIECSDDLCAGSCEEQIVCCKDGVCIGDSVGSTELGMVSETICKKVFGGVSTPGVQCGGFDCCDYSVVLGACCIDETQLCLQVTDKACMLYNGIFMGANTICGEPEDNICCYDNDKGVCCLQSAACNCCDGLTDHSNCCQRLTRDECSLIGGSWRSESAVGPCQDQSSSSCDCGYNHSCDDPISTGACCVGGSCSQQTEGGCGGIGGIFEGGPLSLIHI